MGANQQTSVPAFTAGQILTAQQQTEINTGVPVFADSTARDAAFGGTGEKVLAEGQLAYLEDSNVVQYYDGSSWATLGPTPTPGLELVKTQTIGTTVSSVTVSDVFSADYDSYRVIISGTGVASTSNTLNLTFGATSSGYSRVGISMSTNSATVTGFNNEAAASIAAAGLGSTANLSLCMDVFNPFLATRTVINTFMGRSVASGTFQWMGGYVDNTTSYTAFTLTTSTGTITGGEIRVYGYKN